MIVIVIVMGGKQSQLLALVLGLGWSGWSLTKKNRHPILVVVVAVRGLD